MFTFRRPKSRVPSVLASIGAVVCPVVALVLGFLAPAPEYFFVALLAAVALFFGLNKLEAALTPSSMLDQR